jgi:hypothetical protein
VSKPTAMQLTMLRTLAKRTDPIFPAIEAHRAAWKAYSKASDKHMPDAEIDPLFRAEVRAWNVLIRTVPTSAFGAAALARYVSGYRQLTYEAAGSWEIRCLLKALRHVADCLESVPAI